MNKQTSPDRPSRRQWLIGGALIVAGAAAIAIVFVLPAEYGIDPTGAGRALGLTQMADPGSIELERGRKRTGVLTLEDGSFAADPVKVSDRWQRELAPFEAVEFKYTLNEGDPLRFRWVASGPLTYDMHAHPFAGGEALTESYARGSAASLEGTYVPAFSGIHGWFWRNDSTDNVTLVLEASGTMSESTIYEGSTAYRRPVGGETNRPAQSR